MNRSNRPLDMANNIEINCNFSRNFPTYDPDFVGAMKGMTHLTNSYKLGYRDLSKVLNLEDFINLAIVAFGDKYYDTSIDFIKFAYKIAPIDKNYEVLKDKLMTLKKNILKVHNDLVIKRKTRVGQDFKGTV